MLLIVFRIVDVASVLSDPPLRLKFNALLLQTGLRGQPILAHRTGTSC